MSAQHCLDDAAVVEFHGLEIVHQQGLVIAHGTSAPFFEKPTRPARTFVLPERVEGFLQRQGAVGFQIVFEQVAQFGAVPDSVIGPALEETIAGILENGLVAFRGELFGSLPATSSMASPSFLAMWKRSSTLSAAGSMAAMTFR